MGGNSLANREKGEATCHQKAAWLSILDTVHDHLSSKMYIESSLRPDVPFS